MRTYTLENNSCDVIKKINGKWRFYRTGEADNFKSEKDAAIAISEIKDQGNYTEDIKIVEW